MHYYEIDQVVAVGGAALIKLRVVG